MGKYFENSVYNFKYKPKDIDTLLSDKNYLIVGDFWGIQSFIFEGLVTKNAAKVLRAKSAFVQIFMEVIAKYLCHLAEVEEKYILSINAGKFELLLPKKIEIKEIQNRLNKYFIDNFYGLSGVIIAQIEVGKRHWQENYKEFRKEVANKLEIEKFQKFELFSQNPVLEYDAGIDNQNLCPICNLRKGKNNCKICNTFIDLGKRLTKKERQVVKSDEAGIIFDDFIADIALDKRIKSYIPSKGEEPLSFEKIADNSCKNLESGIKALGFLKADVDSMGAFIKETDITNNFKNFDEFSKGLDSFFSLYITDTLKDKYRNIYTVFAGGDDLLLVGAWDEIMNFAREIRREFRRYTKNRLSISFGIAVSKPSTPASYLANHTEELLESSKDIDEKKDALTIWGETVKWDNYQKVFEELDEKFKNFELNTALLYRLLEFCNMSKNIEKDIKNTMWKSKLNYLFARNVDKKQHYMLEILDKAIEKYPKETKIFLSEFIYKRREG